MNILVEFFRSLCQLPSKFWRRSGNALVSDEAIKAAQERGRIAAATEPRAIAVRYDAQTNRIIVQLRDGSTIEASPHEIRGLEIATAEQLAGGEILGRGSGLRWAPLDVDVSVRGLAAGILETRASKVRNADRSGSDGQGGLSVTENGLAQRPTEPGRDTQKI